MKYQLIFLLLLLFILFTKGNGDKEKSPKKIYRETNNANEDYIPSNLGTVSSGNIDGLTSTWMWLPKENEKNKIKYEAILSFLEKGEMYDVGNVEKVPKKQKVNKQKLSSQENNSTAYVDKDNVLKEVFNGKKQKIMETRYLKFHKHLQNSNWCFKEKRSPTYRNFKKTDACCRSRKLCRTTRHVKRGIYECACDTYFYSCLKKVGEKISTKIGQLYFNRYRVVCYKKYTAQPCIKPPCHVHYEQKNIDYFRK